MVLPCSAVTCLHSPCLMELQLSFFFPAGKLQHPDQVPTRHLPTWSVCRSLVADAGRTLRPPHRSNHDNCKADHEPSQFPPENHESMNQHRAHPWVPPKMTHTGVPYPLSRGASWSMLDNTVTAHLGGLCIQHYHNQALWRIRADKDVYVFVSRFYIYIISFE